MTNPGFQKGSAKTGQKYNVQNYKCYTHFSCTGQDNELDKKENGQGNLLPGHRPAGCHEHLPHISLR